MAIIKKCLICGSNFKVIPCRGNIAKYCGRICYNKSRFGKEISEEHKLALSQKIKQRHSEGKYPVPWNKGKTKEEDPRVATKKKTGKFLNCIVCGTSYWTIPSQEKRRKHCSYTCANKYYSETYLREKSKHWKGGYFKTDFDRTGVQYKTWRKNIFNRDLYTCKFCGKKGGELNAHHILPKSVFPDFKYEINNGITLCVACHSVMRNNEALYGPKCLANLGYEI